MADRDIVLGLAVSLAVGILVGLERERRKGSGPGREAAGVRTFALAGLAGGAAYVVGGVAVTAVALGFVSAAAVASYVRSPRNDPGLTTEVALVMVFLLGALSVNEPILGAGLGVAVAALLSARSELHRFARSVITEEELHDLLLLAAAATIVLPLLPNREMGPYDAFNPFALWRLVVLVMAIGGAGYVAVRLVGARAGLPVAGLAGGFVSSSATIGSMGALARRQPALTRAATSAAVLSTLATVIQMSVVVGAGSTATLRAMAVPLGAAGFVALAFGLLSAMRVPSIDGDHPPPGRPFSLRGAVAFASAVAAILLVAAALNDLAGSGGAVVSASIGGFADAHAAGGSVATLAGRGSISTEAAALSVLAAMTTNTVTKLVVAFVAGGKRFALTVGAGVVSVLVAAWIAAAAVFAV
jgi:uncharacterized membrane protein (DUF4010 family)